MVKFTQKMWKNAMCQRTDLAQVKITPKQESPWPNIMAKGDLVLAI